MRERGLRGLDLERKNSTRRAKEFLATSSGGRRLEKIA
jgi:hypothetical protein